MLRPVISKIRIPFDEILIYNEKEDTVCQFKFKGQIYLEHRGALTDLLRGDIINIKNIEGSQEVNITQI